MGTTGKGCRAPAQHISLYSLSFTLGMQLLSFKYLNSTISKVNQWLDIEFSEALKKHKLVNFSIWKIVLLCIVLAAASGLYSVSLGVDQNWDLRNYHLYNPFAELHNRYLYDIAPAQLQSYLNPLLDFPFFLMITFFNDWPRSIAFVQGTIHGANLVAISLLAWHLIGSIDRVSIGLRLILTVIALLIGVTGAGSAPLVGTTTGDVEAVAPMLIALTLIVYAIDRAKTEERTALRKIAVAGLLSGVSVGAKLTMGCYGLALLLSLVLLPRTLLIGGFMRFAAASIAGVLVSGGFHFFRMWRTFGNPLFPLFNNIFLSPYWDGIGLRDIRFLPKTSFDYLFYPFEWALKVEHGIVSELAFRDIRIALVVTLGGLAAAKWTYTRVKGHANGTQLSPGAGVLALFTLVSYLSWLLVFSIYRYLVPIELLSGISIVLALEILVVRSTLLISSAAIAAICIITTVPLNWGHTRFGNRYIDFKAPKVAVDTLVIIVGADAVSYFIPFFDHKIRWVSIKNNFLRPEQNNLLMEHARQLIQEHRGPLLMLQAGATNGDRDAILTRLSLVRGSGPCTTLSSNLTSEHFSLCPIVPGNLIGPSSRDGGAPGSQY